MDHVTFRREGRTRNADGRVVPLTVDGRIVLTAQDGGLLFLARDGVLWRILPMEIVKQTTDDVPFRAYSPEQMTKSVLADLPKGFKVYDKAKHYLIYYDSSQAYAAWCGAMFERLYTAFYNAWKIQHFDLVEPEFPLVAIIFSNKASYVNYSKDELGDAADSIFGYYNMESNRMIMYDLVGVAQRLAGRSGGIAQINELIARSNSPGMVTTIVHEATHQIAFNSGLHQRLSDCPKWFSEGIAMYCETPDLKGTKGWAGIGVVNSNRLEQFRLYQQKRPADSLEKLIGGDQRLVNPEQVVEAYSESWALTFYLIHKHPKEYVAYLRVLSRKQPLVVDTKATRIAEFEKQFGPLDKLDADFVNFMQGVH